MTQPLRVLVVDDDTVFMEQFAAFLVEEGHAATGAPSTARAVDELERRAFHIVFTDLRMPRHGGIELLREVVRRWPHTLVVVVTGYATVETAVEAMKIGAFDYVQKPFRPDEIRRVLALGSEELAFSGLGLAERDPWALANELSARDDREILVIASHGDPTGRKGPKVTSLIVDGAEPYRVLETVQAFLADRARAGVVLADATRMVAGRSLEDIVSVARQLKDLTQGKGPVALGLDPRQLPGETLKVLREVFAAPVVHGVVEALASPIRRSILRRLEAGPASFKDVMRAAGVEDSPKLSFHLRKLGDEGLVGRLAETYRLTEKGVEAMRALRRFEEASTMGAGDFMAFVTNP